MLSSKNYNLFVSIYENFSVLQFYNTENWREIFDIMEKIKEIGKKVNFLKDLGAFELDGLLIKEDFYDFLVLELFNYIGFMYVQNRYFGTEKIKYNQKVFFIFDINKSNDLKWTDIQKVTDLISKKYNINKDKMIIENVKTFDFNWFDKSWTLKNLDCEVYCRNVFDNLIAITFNIQNKNLFVKID